MRGYPQDGAEELRRGIQSSRFAPLLAGAPFVHIADLRLIVDYWDGSIDIDEVLQRLAHLP